MTAAGLIASRVALTAFRDEDRERLFAWVNTPELIHFNSAWAPVHAPAHAAWFAGLGADPRQLAFAIRTAEDGRLIGIVQLKSIHPIHRSAELAIRIGEPNAQGRGLGTEALRVLLGYARRELNLNRVSLQVFADNARAIASYRKAGFVEEGRLRRAVFINGGWQDVLVMAVLLGKDPP